MAKHRRFSDKPKSDSPEKEIEYETQTNKTLSEKSPRDIKSILLSGTKYAYIIAAAALLCGIYTPFTDGEAFSLVIYGMLTILLGLGGAVLIHLGIKNEKFTRIMVCGGLGLLVASLILIHELSENYLF
jgi:hypothetical protein